MFAGVVLGDIEAHSSGREPAHRLHHREGVHDPVALGGDEVDAGGQKFLLRVEDIEGRALADPRLLAHAAEGDLGRLHLRLRGDDLGARGFELAPGRYNCRTHLVAGHLRLDAPLADRLLGLANTGVDLAALIYGYGQAGHGGGGERLSAWDLRVKALGHAARNPEGREQLAFRDFDLKLGHIDGVKGGENRRVLPKPNVDGHIDRARQQAIEGPPRRELARLDPDHLSEQRHAGAQVRFGKADLRLPGGKPCLSLRHVRARHLADIEAVAGLAELLLDNLHVVALEVEDGRVAQDIHVGLSAVEQHGLLSVAEGLTGAENLRLRLPGRVHRAIAVEQRLVHLDPGAAWVGGGKILVYPPARGQGGAKLGPGLGILRADVGRGAYPGAPERQRPRHVLVRRPHAGTLGAERRIATIGARQRAVERFGRNARTGAGAQ